MQALHSEQESYRGTIRLATPEGEQHTVIVLRRGAGRASRTWLTLNGAIRTTVVMTRQQAEQIVVMIQQASA